MHTRPHITSPSPLDAVENRETNKGHQPIGQMSYHPRPLECMRINPACRTVDQLSVHRHDALYDAPYLQAKRFVLRKLITDVFQGGLDIGDDGFT